MSLPLPLPAFFVASLLPLLLASISSHADPASNTSNVLSEGESLLRAMRKWGASYATWVGQDPCRNWTGIVCDGNGRVISLNLSNTGITGPIPEEIANLRQLRVLDICNPRNAKPPLNRVSGDLSPLKGLIHLENLNVSFNPIHLDSFPTAVFSLVNLISMRIDNTRIKGPLPLEVTKFTKLQYLYLGNSSLTGPLPPEYGTLINLKEMSLWNNNLKSKIPPEFGNLYNLTYLNLHECNLYGGLPPELGRLSKLRNISLFGNRLTGEIPDSWCNMTSLSVLWLHKNSLTKYFPAWLPELPNLYNVSLDENLFYGPVSNFSFVSVQIISLTCNYFSGELPTQPKNLILNTSGNCFDPINDNDKIRCQQIYFNCETFFDLVSNGSCPQCPGNQVLEDEETCVCTISTYSGGNESIKGKFIGSIIGAGVFILLLVLLSCMWLRRKTLRPLTRHNKKCFEKQGYISDLWDGPEGVVHFKLRDIIKATDNFHSRHEIGSGGFGRVLLAELEGRQVAVKCAHLSSIQSSASFRNEVLLLSRLHHKNLVRLLGFCEDEGIQILVYEYMPNGNLHTLLYKSKVTLDWLTRLDIAIGVAHGLEYLHSFADPPVIHRDVKPSNILLDSNMVAKLADFGISKVASSSETHFETKPAGTAGYIDPQYVMTEQLTTASDVYSFGMVLLELISGQKCIDNARTDGRNLAEWVNFKLEENDLLESVVDPRLSDAYPNSIFRNIVRLGLDCASFKIEDRPSIKAVISVLESCRWEVSTYFSEEGNTPSVEHASGSQVWDKGASSCDGGGTATDCSNNSLSVSVLLPR